MPVIQRVYNQGVSSTQVQVPSTAASEPPIQNGAPLGQMLLLKGRTAASRASASALVLRVAKARLRAAHISLADCQVTKAAVNRVNGTPPAVNVLVWNAVSGGEGQHNHWGASK